MFEEKREAGGGQEYVMQKAGSEISISLGGAWEEKKNSTCKMMPLFLLGIFVLFKTNILALSGQDSLCLCTYTE